MGVRPVMAVMTPGRCLYRLSAAYGRLIDALAAVAALTLLGLVCLVTLDIVLRNVAPRGLTFANEVSEYALYLMTLLAAPWLLRRGQHIRLDIVLVQLPPRIAWWCEAATDIVGFFVCVILVRYGVAMTLASLNAGAITIKNLVFPEWWLLAPLPVVFALIAIEFVFRFHRLLSMPGRRTEATSVG